MSSSLFRPMINLGNSIVGVSILTMPWCYTQCGLILGTLLLLLSALLTTWTCKMLLRAAQMTRQHSYETLGYAVLGSVGKLSIELSNIGLGIGSCVGFYVIIGDLLPPVVAHVIGIELNPGILRGVVLVLSAIFVAFPLTLIRNVDRLSVISVGSLAFYLFFIAQLVFSSRSNIMRWEVWSGSMVWWQNMGILKCLPIFSLAFCCQSQMFVIYTSLRDGSVRKMSTVVDGAIVMVTTAYLMVAVFGYFSYATVKIHGDVLANFPHSILSQVTRLGFAVTVMLSFPLIVFPCRVSLNSLLYPEKSMELHIAPPIPQGRFVTITAGIMFSTLFVAILIPNIQTVLALVGATLGSLICFIFPGLYLSKVAGSSTEFSRRAKFCVVLGFTVLILSTFVTLSSWSDESTPHYQIKPPPVEIIKAPPLIATQQTADNQQMHENVQQKNVVLDVPFDPGAKNADTAKDPPIEDVAKDSDKVVHEQLEGKIEELVEKVGKLEEANKDLRERQEEIEKVKGLEAPNDNEKESTPHKNDKKDKVGDLGQEQIESPDQLDPDKQPPKVNNGLGDQPAGQPNNKLDQHNALMDQPAGQPPVVNNEFDPPNDQPAAGIVVKKSEESDKVNQNHDGVILGDHSEQKSDDKVVARQPVNQQNDKMALESRDKAVNEPINNEGGEVRMESNLAGDKAVDTDDARKLPVHKVDQLEGDKGVVGDYGKEPHMIRGRDLKSSI